MTDTEKKIAEIREALERATPRWHDNGNEIVSLDNPRVGIGGFLRDEDNYLGANAQEWLRFLLEELITTRNSWLSPDTSQRLIEDLIDKVDRLNKMTEERDKLIEGLRWYADEDTHMIKRRPDGDYAPIALDHGQRARDILREVGVSVDA